MASSSQTVSLPGRARAVPVEMGESGLGGRGEQLSKECAR